MKIEPKTNCPLNNFEPCKQLDCAWFIKIVGTNPQTGKEIDEWGCAIAWVPVLLIENSQQQRQTGAAVESFRNEMVKANETSHKVLLASMREHREPLSIQDGSYERPALFNPHISRNK